MGTAKEVAPIVTNAASSGGGATAAANSKTGGTAVPTVPGAPNAAAPVRKLPGAKEVIPFEWKLLGDANGLTFTLFKSVERDEVDAQFKRLEGDVYYTKLRVVSAGSKIKQSASAVKAAVPSHSKLRAEVVKKPKAKAKTKKSAASSDAPTVIAIPRSEKFPTAPKTAKRKKASAKKTKKAKGAKVKKTTKKKVTAKKKTSSAKSAAIKKKTTKKTAAVKKTKTAKKKTTTKTTKKTVAKKKATAKKKKKR